MRNLFRKSVVCGCRNWNLQLLSSQPQVASASLLFLSSHNRHKHTSSTKDDLVAARRWRDSFSLDSIPARICDLSFTRSSGPGGQKVNKVSSKAMLRVSLTDLLPLLPVMLHQNIRCTPQYAKNSDSLLIQADESRKQSENTQACFARLHKLILDVAAGVIPGDTSDSQCERVRKLQQADNEQRIKMKKAHSQKKAGRRGSSDD